MAGKIVGDAVCPGCRASGGDSKGNHLILFESDDGKRFAKCPKCGHYEKDPTNLVMNEKKVWNADELNARLKEISEYPTKTLEDRRIPDWVCEHYGVKVGLSTTNGKDIVEHYYPRFDAKMQLCRYNIRVCNPKGFYSVGPNGLPFGINTLFDKNVSTTKLFIFEDELSTMSAYVVLKQFAKPEWKHMHPACIGLSAGSGTIAQTLQTLIDMHILDKYEEVIYVHDNDDAGRESYQVGRSLYPDLKGVTTALKDANDMLMDGRNKELFRTIIRGAKVRSPDGAANVSDALKDSLLASPLGLSLPWDGLTQLLVGLRWGELWSIGGASGAGKTLLAHAISSHFIKVHKIPCALFMMEERIGKTLINIATHLTGVKKQTPEEGFLEQVIQDFELEEHLHLWKNKGENSWDNVAQCIRFYAVVMGCKLIFVDNVTALVNTMSPSEQNTEIARIGTEAAGLADELGITIVVFSHLNPPSSGPSHEEGGEVRPVQFTGSRALQRWSHVMLGFERNLYAEGEFCHYSKIRVLKDREGGKTGFINTRYDPDTGLLNEHDESFSAADEEVFFQ